jgi:hypothetical protein
MKLDGIDGALKLLVPVLLGVECIIFAVRYRLSHRKWNVITGSLIIVFWGLWLVLRFKHFPGLAEASYDASVVFVILGCVLYAVPGSRRRERPA